MCALCFAVGEDKQDKLVLHEWGTFISLQDEEGKAISGINTDDEPVPKFVHRLSWNNLLSENDEHPKWSQGAVYCHPDVTMRLETPVIYFHPSEKWRSQPVKVHVAFRGGWLTEFYPDAIFQVPGFDATKPKEIFSNEAGEKQDEYMEFGHIKTDAAGELSWKKLTVGTNGTGPNTTEKVWLAPRDVKAATVQTARSEREKFLFYRGVGNVDAPLRIARNDANKTLEVRDNHRGLAMLDPDDNLRIHAAWLVDFRPDGACAFKSVGEVKWGKEIRAVVPASFNTDDFSPKNMPRLQDEMRKALITDGLFADEADALLKTWQVSYFKSPGLRFFYLCPRADIENTLPLEISVPCIVTRVMIGRIELVTPGQRVLLKEISTALPPRWIDSWEDVKKSAGFAAYVKLGRFRNALILDEQKRRPPPTLKDFIKNNNFEAYKIE